MRRLGLLLFATAISSGCFSRLESDSPHYFSCNETDPCPEPWKCGRAGFCFDPAVPARLDCDVNEHCPEGFACGLDERCFDTAGHEALRCETDSHCGGGWRCGLNKICYDRDAAGAIACLYDGGVDPVATECAPTWRCGLEGVCHPRDAGAPYLCEDDRQCEGLWRCGLEKRCVDTQATALRDVNPAQTITALSPAIRIDEFASVNYPSFFAYSNDGGLNVYKASGNTLDHYPVPDVSSLAFADSDYLFAAHSGGVFRYPMVSGQPPALAYDGGALELRVLRTSSGPPTLAGFSGSVVADLFVGQSSVVGGSVNDLGPLPNASPTTCGSNCRPSLLAATDKGLFWAPAAQGGGYFNLGFGFVTAPVFRPVHLPGTSSSCDGGADVAFRALRTREDQLAAASADTVWVYRRASTQAMSPTCSDLGVSLELGPCVACPSGESLVDLVPGGASFFDTDVKTLCRRDAPDGGVELRSYLRRGQPDAGCGPLQTQKISAGAAAGYRRHRAETSGEAGLNSVSVPMLCPGPTGCELLLWSGAHTRATGSVDAGLVVYRQKTGLEGSATGVVNPELGLMIFSGAQGVRLGTIEEFPSHTFIGYTGVTSQPAGLWLSAGGESSGVSAYLDRSVDIPHVYPSSIGREDLEPPSVFSDIARLPDGGLWLVAAAEDRVWAGEASAFLPGDGGVVFNNYDRIFIKMVPLPFARMEAITAWAPPSGSPMLNGYLIAQQRLFRYQAFSASQWIPDEIRLPAGAEPVDVWMDEGRGRVGTQDGRVFSLPIPVAVSTQLPEIAPRALDYAEVCGTAVALSPTALYLLRADSGPVGRWQRLPLEQRFPAFGWMPAHFSGPLHVTRSDSGADLVVFSTSGAVTRLEFSCP